jgi:hypothetical protein
VQCEEINVTAPAINEIVTETPRPSQGQPSTANIAPAFNEIVAEFQPSTENVVEAPLRKRRKLTAEQKEQLKSLGLSGSENARP